MKRTGHAQRDASRRFEECVDKWPNLAEAWRGQDGYTVIVRTRSGDVIVGPIAPYPYSTEDVLTFDGPEIVKSVRWSSIESIGVEYV